MFRVAPSNASPEASRTQAVTLNLATQANNLNYRVISDGLDTKKENQYKEFKQELAKTDAIIYAIGFTDTSTRPMDNAGEMALIHWSEMTGGMALFPKSAAKYSLRNNFPYLINWLLVKEYSL